MREYILVIDEGTTGTRAVITDTNYHIVSFLYESITQYSPKPGYVEHDFNEIYQKSVRVCQSAIQKAQISSADIRCIGITNQRNTVGLWSKTTGEPLCAGIVWQDTRTSELLEEEKKKDYVKDNQIAKCGRAFVTSSGVIVLKWLMQYNEKVAEAIRNGDALYGTVETWLIWKLTGGKTHAMTYSNASSLGIYDFETEGWCQKVFDGAGVPMHILPKLYSEAGDFGSTDLFGTEIPITGAIGDQQASMFAQNCRQFGQTKATNGTGTFFDVNIGEHYMTPIPGVATMVAWNVAGQKRYLYEGMLPTTGAAISWLKDGMGLILTPEETEKLALSVPDSHGLIFVCTLAGAFVPKYDPYARGTLFGIEIGTTKAHVVRAVLEGIAFGFADIMEIIKCQKGISMEIICIDGGVSKNNFLAQCLADFVGCKVQRDKKSDFVTALGAAQIAAIGAGICTMDEARIQDKEYDVFEPHIDEAVRRTQVERYQNAVRRASRWADV